MLVLHPTVAATWLLRFWTNLGYGGEPLQASPNVSAVSSLSGGMSYSEYDGHPVYPHPLYACLFMDYASAKNARNGVGRPEYETACGRWRPGSIVSGHVRTVSSALDNASSTLRYYGSFVRATVSTTLSSTLDRYPAVSASIDKSAALVKGIRPAVYESSCVKWQPNAELQMDARVVPTLLSLTLGMHPVVFSVIDEYGSSIGGYAVRAHDAACRALRPRPVRFVGFLRDNMSVPSTLGTCGRGTESLYPTLLRDNTSVRSTLGTCGRGTKSLYPILLRGDTSVLSTLGTCGRGTESLWATPPRATPIPVLWKVVSAPRVVVICYCFVLLALATLSGCAKQLYLDGGIYLSPVCGVWSAASTGSRPLPRRAPARPSPARNVGRRGGPPVVGEVQWKRRWVRRID